MRQKFIIVSWLVAAAPLFGADVSGNWEFKARRLGATRAAASGRWSCRPPFRAEGIPPRLLERDCARDASVSRGHRSHLDGRRGRPGLEGRAALARRQSGNRAVLY